jgi:hypothetical protein
MHKQTIFIGAIMVAFVLTGGFASRAHAQSSLANLCTIITSNLYQGRSDRSLGHAEVSALQQFLRSQGYGQAVTGYFGVQTYQNVLHLQNRYGISPTGTVGPLTRGLIMRLCSDISGSSGQTVGGLTVTSPATGAIVRSGSPLVISWSYPVTPGSASMVIDLYTSQGSKVGTIAVSQNTIGSYTWNVPPYPNTQVCTQQYPNGLCNASIQGQYYVQVSAVSGSGLDANPTVYATGRSGVFTITASTTQNPAILLSAVPGSGNAPLTVTFGLNSDLGMYAVAFGDGTSASMRTGTVAHTYSTSGTYTAQFTSDAACLHSTPACSIATSVIGSVVVRAN